MSEKMKLSWCVLIALLTVCSEASMRFFDFESAEGHPNGGVRVVGLCEIMV